MNDTWTWFTMKLIHNEQWILKNLNNFGENTQYVLSGKPSINKFSKKGKGKT